MQRSLIAVVLAAALLLAAVQLALWKERSLAGADIRVGAAEGEITLRGFATNAIRVSVRPSRA